MNKKLIKKRFCGKGHLFIISAPSGTGKTTLCNALLDRFNDMVYSVSHTTRKPRKGERNAVDYYFISKEDFEKGIRNCKWAEWAEVHDNFYGTSANFINNCLTCGNDVLLDIDVQGTIRILKQYPDSITVFIMPPSLDTLRARLESRGTDNKDVIAKRLVNAREEIAKKDIYRHIVVNDRLAEAITELVSIIEKYHRVKNI